MSGPEPEWHAAQLADLARWLTIVGVVLLLACILVLLLGRDDDDGSGPAPAPDGPVDPETEPLPLADRRVEDEVAAAMARPKAAPVG